MLFNLSVVLRSSSNRLSRRIIPLLHHLNHDHHYQYQCALFYSSSSLLSCSSYSSYSSDRGGGGRGPNLSNHPSVASVLAFRPSSSSSSSDPSPNNGGGVGVVARLPLLQRGGTQPVTVAGFIRTIRNQKQRSFVELGDGSTLFPLQAVLSPSQAKGYVSSFFGGDVTIYHTTNSTKKKKNTPTQIFFIFLFLL